MEPPPPASPTACFPGGDAPLPPPSPPPPPPSPCRAASVRQCTGRGARADVSPPQRPGGPISATLHWPMRGRGGAAESGPLPTVRPVWKVVGGCRHAGLPLSRVRGGRDGNLHSHTLWRARANPRVRPVRCVVIHASDQRANDDPGASWLQLRAPRSRSLPTSPAGETPPSPLSKRRRPRHRARILPRRRSSDLSHPPCPSVPSHTPLFFRHYPHLQPPRPTTTSSTPTRRRSCAIQRQ